MGNVGNASTYQGLGVYSGCSTDMEELMNSTSTTRQPKPKPHAKKYACLPERGKLHAAAARVKIEY